MVHLTTIQYKFKAIITLPKHTKKEKERIVTSMNNPLLEELIKSPEPFKIARKNLDSSKTSTINLVLHTFKSLKPHCVPNINRDHTEIIQLKIMITKLLKKKFTINSFHTLGSVLDPR